MLVKSFVTAGKDKVANFFRKPVEKKEVVAQTSGQTGVIPSPGDNLNAHVADIKEIISEHGKRIHQDRDVLDKWIAVLEKGNTEGFVDHPERWTDKEWASYVSRQKRATNEIILLTRKS